MDITAKITAEIKGIDAMMGWGVVNPRTANTARGIMADILKAENVEVALTEAIAKMELNVAVAGDMGTADRFGFALKTLKGLK
jgi:hypothetical protein